MLHANQKLVSNGSARVEVLEGRRLLSGSPAGGSAVVEGDSLVVTGTRKDDQIVLSVNRADLTASPKVDVTVNGALLGTFAVADLAGGVRVYAGRGDDTVLANQLYDVWAVTLTAFGGKGNDTLVGSTLGDALHGAGGDDSLWGGDGDDALFGGRDADTLVGEYGDDDLSGGAGDDVLYGEAGADHLTGGGGVADQLYGGEGPDTFANTDSASEVLDLTEEDTHAAA